MRLASNIAWSQTVNPNAFGVCAHNVASALALDSNNPYVRSSVVDFDQYSQNNCQLFLLGPFSLVSHKGKVLTPRHQKSRALLAMLAVSPRGSRSRVWLRDKLWSDRSEDQGSASLRQALLDIRKSLGKELRDILIADKYTVTLNLSRIQIDVQNLLEEVRRGETREQVDLGQVSEFFLEGIDIRDPEFEDWLTMERQVWVRRYTSAIDDDTPALPSKNKIVESIERSTLSLSQKGSLPESQQPHESRYVQPSVVIIQPRLLGEDLFCQNVFSLMTDGLARTLLEVGDLRVSYGSDSGLAVDHAIAEARDTPPLAVRIRVIQSEGQSRVGIEVLKSRDYSLQWSGDCQLRNADIVNGNIQYAHGLIERTVQEVTRFFSSYEVNESTFLTGQMYGAVNRMFELAPGDLDRADRTLRTILRERPSAQAYAWLAFAQTFRVGQRFCVDAHPHIEEAQYNANKALELDASNALVLSLVAHIHSYLFSEFDVAAALFERAIRINPAQPMGWDLYAMLHAYVGENEKACAMANWVQFLGQNSPLSYYYDTTKCITSALVGDYHSANLSGRQALCQRPKFNSILRYLISSNAHMGHMEEARKLLEKLRTIEPDFSVSTLLDTGYPVLDTAGGKNFVDGLLKAGVRKD